MFDALTFDALMSDSFDDFFFVSCFVFCFCFFFFRNAHNFPTAIHGHGRVPEIGKLEKNMSQVWTAEQFANWNARKLWNSQPWTQVTPANVWQKQRVTSDARNFSTATHGHGCVPKIGQLEKHMSQVTPAICQLQVMVTSNSCGCSKRTRKTKQFCS